MRGSDCTSGKPLRWVCGSVNMSPFFAEVGDIETKQGQYLVDVAVIDETQAVKLGQARFGLTVFEIANPIVRNEESWVVFLFGNPLADLRDPQDGQVQSLAPRPEASTSFETERRGQHWERLRLAFFGIVGANHALCLARIRLVRESDILSTIVFTVPNSSAGYWREGLSGN